MKKLVDVSNAGRKTKMKKLVDVSNAGMESLIGNRALLFCMRYNYSGILSGVNANEVKLSNAKIVFDTGDFSNKDWAAAETPKSDTIYVRLSSIESYVTFVAKKEQKGKKRGIKRP